MINPFRGSEQEPSGPGATSGESEADVTVPIACDLTAIAEDERAAHEAYISERLFSDAQEILELPDGFALRFEAGHYGELAQFVANERLCCPFFTFVLEVTPAQGPVWLRLTGHAGVKGFLKVLLRFQGVGARATSDQAR